MRSPDTSKDAREAQRAALRRLTGAQRVELAFEMSEEARRTACAGMRSRGLSASEARAHMLRRLLGDELYAAAYEHSRK